MSFLVKSDLLHRKEGFCTKLRIQKQKGPSLRMEKICVVHEHIIDETFSLIIHTNSISNKVHMNQCLTRYYSYFLAYFS